tara:strand:- start:34912 stop:36168 length:1257 start_codon:yes stop_codon:yes gene_type:complete
MKKITLITTILLTILTQIIAQNTQQVSLNPGYTNQSFYSMQNGEVLNIKNDDWDIAFSTDAFSSTIRINDGKGVELYTYHLGDTSSWNSINTNTQNILINPMNNSDTSWEIGAFDQNQISGFDYGWGVYNLQTHFIVGDSLYVIKTINGNYKKLWLEKKAGGTYHFKYANLDGSNQVNQTLPASTYNTKRFVYYSIDQDLIMDREPALSSWDITFTKYITDYPFQGSFMPYSVTGVLSNAGIKIAEADNITNPISYTNYSGHNFESEINTIGYDWKSYSGGGYIIDPDRCFFIEDYNQNIWRLVFTDFTGSLTGDIEFNSELISSSGTNIQNIESISTFTTYPNPAIVGQDITLIYEVESNDAIIRIHDISGKQVYCSNLSNRGLMTHVIPTNILNQGVYIISINIDSDIITKRIVIN